MKAWSINIDPFERSDIRPKPVSINSTEDGVIHMVLQYKCPDCNTHKLIKINWSFLDIASLTFASVPNPPGQFLELSNTE